MYEIMKDIFAFIGVWFTLAVLFGLMWVRAFGR